MHTCGCLAEVGSTRIGAPCAGEVCKRLEAAGVRGRTLTLKLKRRKAGAPEPPKFMGHGSCDNISRSMTLTHFTANEKEVATAARSLLRALRVPAGEVRGVGIAVQAPPPAWSMAMHSRGCHVGCRGAMNF